MKCWQTYNFEKTCGSHKLFAISLLNAVIVFSVVFSFLQSYHARPLHATGFIWFAAGLLAVYPIHKLVHFLSVLTYRPKISWERKYSVLPFMNVSIRQPMPKKRFIFCLALPFFVLTPLLLAGALLMPDFLHYFTMAAAFHTGICSLDFLYIKAIASCPKEAMIEEDSSGLEVLMPD